MAAGGWPLVARDDLLAAAVRAADSGEGRGAVLLGARGAGVSRAVRETVERLRYRGHRVVHVVAPGPPLGLTRADLPTALATLKDLGADTLAIDDAHLLDPDDAETLRLLLLNADLRTVVGAHPAARVPEQVSWLWRSGLLTRIDVTELGLPDAVAVLEGGLEGPLHGASVRLLWRAAGGRPAWLLDGAEAAMTSGALTKRTGLWRVVGPLPASPVMVDRARAELGALPVDLADAFARLAVAGRLPPAVAAVVAGAGRLAALEEAGLVRAEGAGGDAMVPVIPALAVATVEGLGASGRSAAARALLDSGADVPGPQRTRWRVVAGEHPDVEELTAAARDARFAGDLADAELLARRAAAQNDPLATFLLAEICQEEGRREEATRLLEDLSVRPGAPADLRGLASMELATVLIWDLGRPERGVGLARDLVPAAAGSEYEADVSAFAAATVLFTGHPREALLRAGGLLPAKGRSAAEVHLVLAVASGVVGDCARGAAEARRGIAIRAELGDQLGLAGPEIHGVALVLALGEGGWLLEADEIAREAYEHASRAPGSMQGWTALGCARIALLTGAVEDAARFASEAAVSFADLDQHATLRWALAARILAAAYTGRADEAAACVTELDELGSSGIRFLEPDVLRARAFAAAVAGDLDRARADAVTAAGEAAASGSRALEAMAWHDLVRLGGAERAVEPLARLADEVDSAWSRPRAAHARALVDGDVDGLVGAAHAFEAIGARLHAVEAAAHALAAARARGVPATVRATTRELRRLQAACPAARTPALHGPGPAGLTRREGEIAQLAAAGVTSRDISARLGVSVRTVENVLQRAYTKLGVSGRAELAARLDADASTG